VRMRVGERSASAPGRGGRRLRAMSVCYELDMGKGVSEFVIWNVNGLPGVIHGVVMRFGET
jgi:hypothetical protein